MSLAEERRETTRNAQVVEVTLKGRTSSVRLDRATEVTSKGHTRDVSPAGLGLELDKAEANWTPGTSVKVEINLSGRRMVVPARVCWQEENLLGVRLFLELLDQVSRARFQRWAKRSS